MTASTRYLDPDRLPKTLWDSEEKVLKLPAALAQAYETLLDRHGLRELAQNRTIKDSPTGGLDKPSTDKHFAQQFDNSAARSQLAITNATKDIARISNALIQTLSGNMVCVTDAPCGAGAATFSLLCTIAELRAQDFLPRSPLNICLIGAEISGFARDYALEMLSELRPFLESQAIFVEVEMRHWDVTDELSNADLVESMVLKCNSVTKRLVLVANFSGFLSMPGKHRDAEPQLRELFRYASLRSSVVIWMEPQMNEAMATGGLFQKIENWAKTKWHRFMRINIDGPSNTPYLTAGVEFQSSITPERLRPVRLAVMRLDLGRAQ